MMSTHNESVTNNLKYIAYCRKSEEDDTRQVLSIESQVREVKEYAARRDLHLVDILTESKTAHKPGREVFNEMLSRLRIGEANAILVWHANRIARNSKDGGEVIWLMDCDVIKQIDAANNSKEYHNTPDDKFYLQFEFTMAKKSSDDLSQVVLRGIRQKYERGEYPNLAPIGYINGKVEGATTIYPDPERKDLMIRIFTEYASGRYSLGQMAKVAFDWGLRTRKNKPLAKSHLHRVLKNPLYYGCFWHGGELRIGSYEPLITKKLFDDVQEVLQNKSKPKKLENDWAYAGLLKCGGGCGASIIFETKKKYYKKTDRWAEYTYARCSKRCGACKQQGITMTDMESQIDEELQKISISEEDWRLGIKLLNKKYEVEAKQRAQIVDSRHRQYQRLQSELDGYFKMRAREEMTADEFTVKKKNITEEQSRLKEKIDEGVVGQRTWLELAEDFLTTAFQARDMILSDDLVAKRKAVEKVGWNVMLKDKKLVWTFQEPYDILLKPQYRSDLRRGRDSNSRTLAGRRFSKPLHSATMRPLLVKYRAYCIIPKSRFFVQNFAIVGSWNLSTLLIVTIISSQQSPKMRLTLKAYCINASSARSLMGVVS